MKKVKIQKKLFWHIYVDLRGIYASKDKMVRIWPTLKKKKKFILALKSPTYRDFTP